MISIKQATRFVLDHGNGVRRDARHLVVISECSYADGRVGSCEDWVAIRPGDVVRLSDLRDVLGY